MPEPITIGTLITGAKIGGTAANILDKTGIVDIPGIGSLLGGLGFGGGGHHKTTLSAITLPENTPYIIARLGLSTDAQRISRFRYLGTALEQRRNPVNEAAEIVSSRLLTVDPKNRFGLRDLAEELESFRADMHNIPASPGHATQQIQNTLNAAVRGEVALLSMFENLLKSPAQNAAFKFQTGHTPLEYLDELDRQTVDLISKGVIRHGEKPDHPPFNVFGVTPQLDKIFNLTGDVVPDENAGLPNLLDPSFNIDEYNKNIQLPLVSRPARVSPAFGARRNQLPPQSAQQGLVQIDIDEFASEANKRITQGYQGADVGPQPQPPGTPFQEKFPNIPINSILRLLTGMSESEAAGISSGRQAIRLPQLSNQGLGLGISGSFGSNILPVQGRRTEGLFTPAYPVRPPVILPRPADPIRPVGFPAPLQVSGLQPKRQRGLL